jgi:hypothetical protein
MAMNEHNEGPTINLELSPATKQRVDKAIVQQEPRRGVLCPNCAQAELDYDSLLNLTCPHCRYSISGCYT